jgi:hypothetical protein
MSARGQRYYLSKQGEKVPSRQTAGTKGVEEASYAWKTDFAKDFIVIFSVVVWKNYNIDCQPSKRARFDVIC